MTTRFPRRLATAGVALAASAILIATLYPSRSWIDTAPALCIICGERGVADALLNVMLFAPLGIALALRGTSPARTIAIAAALSCFVEVAQLVIPGRDASVGDLIFNSLGAAAGVLLVRTASVWLSPSGRRAARLAVGAAVTIVLLWSATAWLLQPSLPVATYFALWTPSLAHVARYEGRVEVATLDTLALLPGRLPDDASVRRAIQHGRPLRVRGRAGPLPRSLAPVVAIYDEHRREIMLFGADRTEVVWRVRLRAADARLDQPDTRVGHALNGRIPDSSFSAAVRREGRTTCVSLNEQETCALGNTLGRGWSLLLYVEHLPPWFRSLLDALWLTVATAPLGLWIRRTRPSYIALALVALGLALMPALFDLRPSPVMEILGALVGLLVGALVARRSRIS